MRSTSFSGASQLPPADRHINVDCRRSTTAQEVGADQGAASRSRGAQFVERPAGTGATGRPSRSPAARRAWPASAIIAALSVQNSGRGKWTLAPIARRLGERRAQAPVGADAAGDHQPVGGRSAVQRAQRLGHERLDHRVLESARDIGARRVVERAAAHGDHHRGLEPAEAEVEARPVEHRPRKFVHAVAPLLGQRRERRPAGIAEAEQFRGLVEGLARGVVLGFAEHPVAADARDLDQHGVAARDLQRHERELRRVRRAPGPADGPPGDARRRPARPAPSPATARRRRRPAAPRSGRAPRYRRCRQGLRHDRRPRPGSPDHRQQPHDWSRLASSGTTPPYGVQRDLAVDRVRAQPRRRRRRQRRSRRSRFRCRGLS